MLTKKPLKNLFQFWRDPRPVKAKILTSTEEYIFQYIGYVKD